jgi:hypothetical protein
MDKSFNEQELSDIMKEIEALEDDLTAPEEESPSVMEELADLDEKDSVPLSSSNIVSLDSKRVAPKASADAMTAMSFKVQGDLKLDLQFSIGGKVVMLEVTEAGLSIEMEGGVKFTVPVTESTSLKKAI